MVPIPVFGEQLSEESSAFADVTNANARDVPAISVVKPPTPQPVNLPGVNDVVPLPSPPDSTRSSVDVDLEAGRGVRRPVNDDVISSKPSVRKLISPEAASHVDISSVQTSPTGEEDTDLLADSAPLEAILSPSSPELALISQAAVGVAEPSASLSSLDDIPADTTIRLVGLGGSASGVNSTSLDDAEEAVVSDIPVPVVAESREPSPKKEQTHDKTKSSSLSSFKRLSAHLTSGKRKKDTVSNNSVKEAL